MYNSNPFLFPLFIYLIQIFNGGADAEGFGIFPFSLHIIQKNGHMGDMFAGEFGEEKFINEDFIQPVFTGCLYRTDYFYQLSRLDDEIMLIAHREFLLALDFNGNFYHAGGAFDPHFYQN